MKRLRGEVPTKTTDHHRPMEPAKKRPGRPSNPVEENVDFSQLKSIDDPEEYFQTWDLLEVAEKMKRLRGEVPTKTTDHHRPMEQAKKRPGRPRKKSVYYYNFSAGFDIPDVIKAPVSQIEGRTESLSTQEDMAPSISKRTKLPVPSSSSQCDIPDVSVREDSFAEKDKGCPLDELMSAFKNLDESEEENLIRETLQIKEISIGKVCLPDLFNVPADRHVSSTAKQNHLTSGHTPERSPSRSRHAHSKWLKQMLGKDNLNGEPVHPLEIPPDAHNESHIQDGNIEKQAVDISHELSLSKDGKQKAVQKGKKKKQSAKRGKRVPGTRKDGRARGKGKKKETAPNMVDPSARRATRQHNKGYKHESIPNDPPKRTASKAKKPVRCMGIERCNIAPEELNDAKLLQDRQA